MKRLSAAVMKGFAIGMLLALPTWTNAAFEPPQQAGQIVGKVVNSCRPGDPSGIWVYILGRSFIAKTGTDGNFVLNYVPQGVHTIVLDLPPNPPQTIPNVTVSPSSVVDLGTQTIGRCRSGQPQPQPLCPAGSVLCMGICTNPGTDPRNCGSCGNRCETGQTCAAGACRAGQPQPQPLCPAGSVICMGTCTNLVADVRNCGSCGNRCDTNQTCAAGACRSGQPQPQTMCPAGSVLCMGICTNPGTDPRNCGACGIVCQGQQQCVMGRCP